MATPQMPRDDLMKYLRELESRIAQVEKRDPFINSAFTVPSPGVTSVDGTFDSANYAQGSTGWALTSDGNAEFNALTLRGGIIGNAALTEPVRAVQIHNDAQNFAVGTAWSSILTASVTVPSGYSQALILTCATGATAKNSTTAVDFLYTRTLISPGSLPGWAIGSSDVSASGTGVSYDLRSGAVSGMTAGNTLTFTGQVSTAFGSWAAATGNVANLDIAMLWLR